MHPAPRAFTSWSPTPPALRVTPAHGGRSFRLAPARKPGFSLLELVLVLVIVGIIASVAAARLSSLRTGQSVAQGARALADQLVRCRHLALARGEQARLRLNLDAQTAAVHMRTVAGFVDPADAQPPECSLRFGAEAQTLSFFPGDPASPYSATDGSPPPAGQTRGQVDILFYPDARCDPSGRVALQKGTDVFTVVCPPAGRPAYVEAVP